MPVTNYLVSRAVFYLSRIRNIMSPPPTQTGSTQIDRASVSILWSNLHSIVALKIGRSPQNLQTHSSWMIFVFSFWSGHLVLSPPSQNGSCLQTKRPFSRWWGGHQIRRESHSWLTVWGFKIWVFCFTWKGKTRQTFGKSQLNTNKSNWNYKPTTDSLKVRLISLLTMHSGNFLPFSLLQWVFFQTSVLLHFHFFKAAFTLSDIWSTSLWTCSHQYGSVWRVSHFPPH